MVALETTQEYANEIAKRFSPDRIILFGSHAYGEPDDDSDVDLLVVVPTRNAMDTACEIRRVIGHPGFSLDLVVRDPALVEWRLEQHDWFLMDVIERGRVLYEAPDARMDGKGRG